MSVNLGPEGEPALEASGDEEEVEYILRDPDLLDNKVEEGFDGYRDFLERKGFERDENYDGEGERYFKR